MKPKKPLKSLIPATCALALVCAAILSACSQSGSGPDYFEAPEKKEPAADSSPSVDESLAKKSGEEKIIYHVGPVDLPAGTTAEAMLDKPLAMRFQTDKAVWVTAFTPKVVDANGAELPAALLNQATVFNMHEENPLCAGSPNPFMIANSMLTNVELPEGYGYPILASDPLEAKVVLSNPTDKNYTDVYFELALTARPMSELVKLSDVRPMLLELDPCGHAPMDVEPHAFTQRKATYQMPETATLVLANGMLQDYGTAIEISMGKEAESLWRAEALSDENHKLTELVGNPFADPKGIAFKSTDQITVSFAYDNPTDSWLKGAAAGALLFIAPK